MRRFNQSLAAAALIATLAFATLDADAATAKKYQVTGTVTALTDDVVTVTKADGEKFEINRDPKAAGGAELKVGEKVTVMYTMTVASIEAKPAGKTPATKPTK